jgi:hypothetical protein
MKIKDFIELCNGMETAHNPDYCDEFRKLEKVSFSSIWKSGVCEGGSCWDDSEPTYHSLSENETDIKSLDVLFEKLCPTIPFLKYKQVMVDVKNYIHEDSESEYEYYGNYTEWEIKYIKFEDLFKVLVDHEIV